MKFVTNSEVTAFLRCRRKWWLRYVRGKSLKRQSQVGTWQLGNWVHSALAAYYQSSQFEEEVAYDDLRSSRDSAIEQTPEDSEAIRKQFDLAERMVQGYFEWLAETGADADFEVIAAEQSRSAQISEDVTLLGKVDLRVRSRRTGQVGFLDHKTVADLARPTRGEPLNIQFLTYHLLDTLDPEADPDVPKPKGGWKNLLRRVKRTASAKPPFYARHEHWHNDAELEAYWVRLHGVLRDMRAAEFALAQGGDHRYYAYPTPTRDCDWDCPFLAVCPSLDRDPRAAEEMLERDYLETDPLERYNEEADTGGID